MNKEWLLEASTWSYLNKYTTNKKRIVEPSPLLQTMSLYGKSIAWWSWNYPKDELYNPKLSVVDLCQKHTKYSNNMDNISSYK